MELKWAGALLITLGCSLAGFSLAAVHLRTEYLLTQLVRGIEFMACELKFHLTPLPELLQDAARNLGAPIKGIFHQLALELEKQESPDGQAAMERILCAREDLPEMVRDNLRLLGANMGKFDLEGQLSGLDTARASCRSDLDDLARDKTSRLNSYRTLGVCAGAALAILLI